METRDVANAVNCPLAEGLTEVGEKFAVLQHIAAMPECDQVSLPSTVKDWFNVTVDKWDELQAQTAADAGAAAAQEVINPPTPESVKEEKVEAPVQVANPADPGPVTVDSESSAQTDPVASSVEASQELTNLAGEAGQPVTEEKKERKVPKTRKKERVLKQGTNIHAFLTVLRAEPPSVRGELIPKMIEELKKYRENVDPVKANKTLQAYISSALNPKYAHEAGVLCVFGKDKVIEIKEYPYPPVVLVVE